VRRYLARILPIEILTLGWKSIFIGKSVATWLKMRDRYRFSASPPDKNQRIEKGNSNLNIKKGANEMNSSAIRKKRRHV
jgi:hypothetical protein